MNFEQLKERAIYTGIYNKVCDRTVKAFEKLKKKYPGSDDKTLQYHALRLIICDHVKENLIDLSKWCYGPEWIGECHEVCWDFLQRGFDALPEKYLKAKGHGAFFKYDPKASVDIVMMPRGVGKTFTFSALRALQDFIKDPTTKWLIGHSDVLKAQKNLDSVKNAMLNPFLVELFPEMFAATKEEIKRRGGKVTREKVNIVFNEVDESGRYMNARPEASFTVASPKVDRTGFHVDGIYLDDLVINDTSKTPEATAELYQYYRSLWGLRELGKDFKIHITGTEWYENSLYTILKKLPSKVTVFEMPAQWVDKEEDYRLLPRVHTDDYLEEQKVMMGEDYAPQMLMQPKTFQKGIHLTNDLSFVFAFKDDPNPPPHATILNITKKELQRKGGIVTSFDPSYSTRDKSWNDDSSKATIISGAIHSNSLYIYDSWQSLGEEIPKLYEALRNQVIDNNSNMVVVDSQSYQKAMSDMYKSKLREDMPERKINFIYHTKASVKGTTSKAERAMYFLADLFNERIIYVHYSQKRLIEEIMRQRTSYDFLDCLIQIKVNINFELASKIYKEERRITNFTIPKRTISRPTFSTTGY